MTIEVLVEQSQDNNWAASSDTDALRGVIVAIAPTRLEALAKFRIDLVEHIAFQKERGFDIPSVTAFEVREIVAV